MTPRPEEKVTMRMEMPRMTVVRQVKGSASVGEILNAKFTQFRGAEITVHLRIGRKDIQRGQPRAIPRKRDACCFELSLNHEVGLPLTRWQDANLPTSRKHVTPLVALADRRYERRNPRLWRQRSTGYPESVIVPRDFATGLYVVT